MSPESKKAESTNIQPSDYIVTCATYQSRALLDRVAICEGPDLFVMFFNH